MFLASDMVDHTVDNMVKTEGLNKPFVPFDYIYNMVFNILATSAFGKRLINLIISEKLNYIDFSDMTLMTRNTSQ